MLRRPLLIFCAALGCLSLPATGATLTMHLDLPDSLTVGDLFHLTVGIKTTPAAQVLPPAPDDGFGNVSVNEWISDRTSLEDTDSTTFSYVMSIYVPEPCTLPELRFLVIQGDQTDTLLTEPRVLPLISVVPPDADSVDIRDLKSWAPAGKPSLLWLWSILAVAAVVLGAVFLRNVLHGRQQAATGPPPLPPYEQAVAALQDLERQNLLRQGLVQEWVFQLSDIVKRYAGRHFGAHVLESTTEEVLDWLKTCPVERELRNGLEWFFTETDPVKFARVLPDDDTLKRMLREVRRFIDETHRASLQEQEAEDTPPADTEGPHGA